MTWEVEYTDEFGEWFRELDVDAQEEVAASIDLLMEHGPIWASRRRRR